MVEGIQVSHWVLPETPEEVSIRQMMGYEGLPDLRAQLKVPAGDHLDLQAGVIHDAQVSVQGVVCLEARLEAQA
jgi:hypothetical protein